MSRTTILGILENGDVESFVEYHNSHGTAPYIWHVIFTRRGIPSAGEPVRMFCIDEERPRHGYMSFTSGAPQLISSTYLPHCSTPEAWAMAMTFDNAVITRKTAPLAARWLRSFLENVSPWLDRGGVNHWPKILALLDDMPEQYIGIAINQTSCGDCEMFSGVYGDDDDDHEGEPRPYNINVDDKHVVLTSELIDEWMGQRTSG